MSTDDTTPHPLAWELAAKEGQPDPLAALLGPLRAYVAELNDAATEAYPGHFAGRRHRAALAAHIAQKQASDTEQA